MELQKYHRTRVSLNGKEVLLGIIIQGGVIVLMLFSFVKDIKIMEVVTSILFVSVPFSRHFYLLRKKKLLEQKADITK
jgi:hypothetical protein